MLPRTRSTPFCGRLFPSTFQSYCTEVNKQVNESATDPKRNRAASVIQQAVRRWLTKRTKEQMARSQGYLNKPITEDRALKFQQEIDAWQHHNRVCFCKLQRSPWFALFCFRCLRWTLMSLPISTGGHSFGMRSSAKAWWITGDVSRKIWPPLRCQNTLLTLWKERQTCTRINRTRIGKSHTIKGVLQSRHFCHPNFKGPSFTPCLCISQRKLV